MYGRRPIYIVTGALFAVLILPVALAPNYTAVVASRVFSGSLEVRRWRALQAQ